MLHFMAEQDELSQLMPTLYSKVRLTSVSDETANLAQYKAVQYPLAVPSSGVVQTQAGKLNTQLEAPTRPQPLLDTRLARGTGRVVARRGFDLQLR